MQAQPTPIPHSGWNTCFRKKEGRDYGYGGHGSVLSWTSWDEIKYSGKIIKLDKGQILYETSKGWIDSSELRFPERADNGAV